MSDDAPLLTPVETVAGEAMRQRAMGVLIVRHDALSARKGQYDFSEIERQHLQDIERALCDLVAMAPVGPLLATANRRMPTLGWTPDANDNWLLAATERSAANFQ